MSTISRRQLLVFFGATAATTTVAPQLVQKLTGQSTGVAQARTPLVTAAQGVNFTPLRLPHPLDIYTEKASYLRTSSNAETLPATADPSLLEYEVIDDLVIAPEFERYVIVQWGDRVFPQPTDYFGYNADYTGFVPIGRGDDDGYLWVNHEYISFPFSSLAPEAPADLANARTSFEEVLGVALPTEKNRLLLGEFMYNQGGSVVRIRRGSNGRYAVQARDAKNRRIHGLSGLGLNQRRTDGYEVVTEWGTFPHQQGDLNFLIGTGPAATDVFLNSSDGLQQAIIGTAYNCSGGTTPWGTILSCEENFQGSELFFVGVQENVNPNGTQTEYIPGTTGAEFGLVGEKYGWVVEVDPTNPEVRGRKHTAMGRFRHENVALRVEANRRLIAYMGDDRRGGHTWKFVSQNTVKNPSDKNNSKLFENGTLYVAKFNPNGTGVWLPLVLSAPTNPIPPSVLASVELAALGSAQRNGLLKLPQRVGIGGAIADGGAFNVDITNEATVLPDYRNKTLADFYPTQGAVLVDAFLAANLIGGTPTGRPEDLEVNPRNPSEVFIAYTDGVPGSDGYPDSRILTVAKYSSAVDEEQPYGGLYKIIEDSPTGEGLTFTWERFTQAGEAGATSGFGYANIDNLAFDPRGNIWMVTDMSTSRHNGFSTGANPSQRTIDHTATGGTDGLVGVFGNNWLLYTPVEGPDAGETFPVAYGPIRCEMTGPTFLDDTLILSVQHPGEDVPINDGQTPLNRDIEMLKLDGTLFTQNRTLPLGSSFPSNLPTAVGGAGDATGAPRPCVMGIRRR